MVKNSGWELEWFSKSLTKIKEGIFFKPTKNQRGKIWNYATIWNWKSGHCTLCKHEIHGKVGISKEQHNYELLQCEDYFAQSFQILLQMITQFSTSGLGAI